MKILKSEIRHVFSAPLLQQRGNPGKKCIEDQRRNGECSIGRRGPVDKSVPGLDQNQDHAKGDDAGLARDRTISFEIKDDAAAEDCNLQNKFQTAVIPKAKTNFPSVIVDGEIRTMNDQIQYPMGKDGKGDN